MRARYGSGGMFMIDMQGLRDLATRSRSSRTPGERYCGSCIARPTRSYFEGSASVPVASTLPGAFFELISTSPSRPFTGMRTIAPFELMSAASCGRQTSVTSWPPSASFTPSSEPYDAPKMRFFMVWTPGCSESSIDPGASACLRRASKRLLFRVGKQDRAVHVLDARATAERHRDVELLADDLQRHLDAALAICAQAVEERAA